MFWYSDNILPDANHKRFKIKEPKSKENEKGDPNEKYKFVFIGPDGTTYFFQHYSGTRQSGTGVTILQEQADTLTERWDAKSMEWDNDWVIHSGTHRTFPSGRVVATQFKQKVLKELKDTPSDLVNNRVFPEEMTLHELERRIQILKRSGESTRRFETQWHFRISSCFVNFILVIIGVSVAANTARRGLILRFGVAIFALFCHFILLRFGLILGENGELSPAMGAWIGNIVFGFFALVLYWRMGKL